jgi:hypothetical protein
VVEAVALMRDRELADDAHALAEDSLAAAAETLPDW